MDKKVINCIKSLSIDMINSAGSGHPGICLGAAPILYTLFLKHLKFNKEEGDWINRDRFIMSAGHGSALLYSTLFYAGYPIELEELKKFRQIDSRISGHPELDINIGIECTTGPLGQGFATAVGCAIAEEYLRNNINKEIIDHFTYVLVSDGDLMEGISYEAASLAGSLKLSKLIVLYDSNNISLDRSTAGVFDENVLKRFEACGWHTELVNNGEDINLIDKAIFKAKNIIDKPSIIEIKTIIGNGSELQGTSEVHGKPLSEEDVDNLKIKLEVSKVPFHISKDAVLYFRESIDKRVTSLYNDWVEKYNSFKEKDGVLKKLLVSLETGEFKIDLKKVKINFEENYKEELRVTNGKLINLIGELSSIFMCGSADLATSTKVKINKGKDFKINGEYGKNINFGVRESLMGAVANGLALNNIRPIIGTFLVFSDYMKPAIRLSALMNLPVTYVFTHDSIGIGEDGPTHQPIEQLGMLRSIPNMTVFRPADIREVVGSWDYAINQKVPVSIVASKEKVPQIQNSSIESVSKGAYIIKEEISRLQGIIMASGVETHTAIKVSEELAKKGIYVRVISVPSIELFLKQNDEYKESLLPLGYKIIVIEASNDSKWNEFVYKKKYLLNLSEFGKSGKGIDVLKKFELDTDSLVVRIEKLLK